MKNKIIILTVLLCGVGLSSCQDDESYVLNPNDQKEFSNWRHVFESFWNGMNYSYAFWDVDPTDWDDIYAEYAPRFDGLKFGNSADSIAAANLFEQACEGLIDHHFLLNLKDQWGKPWKLIKPADKEIRSRDYYHKSYSFPDLMNTVYRNKDLGRISSFHGTATQDNFFIWSYLLDGDIVCLGFSEFAINAHLSDENVMESLDNYYTLINETANLKGIIIDTRGNSGGDLGDIKIVLSPLLSSSVILGYTRSKCGLGRLDFTPFSPFDFNPLSPETNPVKRNVDNVAIVALADINSASMGEMTPMAIMAMPNGTLVGERTLGAHGPLANDINVSYSGSLENRAFFMRTSTLMTKRLDGKCYEGYGVVPDIEALFDADEFYNGNDTQLDRAAQFIHIGK